MEFLNKSNKIELLGKKSFLSDYKALIALLNYENGLQEFDKLLDGKSQKDFKAVIHLNLFPKGLEVKLAKTFKSYSYGVQNSEIDIISFSNPQKPILTLLLKDKTKLTFGFQSGDFTEIIDLFNKSYSECLRIVDSDKMKFCELFPFLKNNEYKKVLSINVAGNLDKVFEAKKDAEKKKAKEFFNKDIQTGAYWFLGGVVATALTYLIAYSPVFIVFYGAIFYGMIKMLIGYRKSKTQN